MKIVSITIFEPNDKITATTLDSVFFRNNTERETVTAIYRESKNSASEKLQYFKHDEHFYFLQKINNQTHIVVIKVENNETINNVITSTAALFVHLNNKSYPDLKDIISHPEIYTLTQIGQMKNTIDEVKRITLENIDKLFKRGETLEELSVRASRLERDAINFNRVARKLNRRCCDPVTDLLFSCCPSPLLFMNFFPYHRSSQYDDEPEEANLNTKKHI